MTVALRNLLFLRLPILQYLSLSQNPLNRSPFLLLHTSLASYLLFSATLCPSVSGACLVGAGSALLASLLGFAAESLVIPLSFPFATFCLEDVGYRSSCSRSLCCRAARSRSRWRFACLSALTDRFAKKYAPAPAMKSVVRVGRGGEGGERITGDEDAPAVAARCQLKGFGSIVAFLHYGSSLEAIRYGRVSRGLDFLRCSSCKEFLAET